MRYWTTYVYALQNGEAILYEGKPVQGINQADAQERLNRNGMGYLSVGDECTGEVYGNKKINYLRPQLN